MNFKKDFLKSKSAFLITDPKNILYLSNFPASHLLITDSRNFLFTDSRYILEAKKISNFSIQEITPTKKLTSLLSLLIRTHKIKILKVEEDDIRLSEYLTLKKNLKVSIQPAKSPFSKMRQIKSQEEIKKIKQAVRLADEAFEYTKNIIKEGISEKEIAHQIINFFYQNNAESSFFPIVAFGENSAIPHHQTSDAKLEKQNIILLDYGAKVNHYCSDITRIIFFGPPYQKQVEVYNSVLEAQEKTICALRKFKEARAVDKVARNDLQKRGLLPHQHSTGHGIGLDIHEKPSLSLKSKDILKEGMVFSIEPGVYLPNLFGIRIEDLVYLSPTGPEVLTKANKKLTIIK